MIVNNFDRVAPPAWVDFPDYAGFLEEKDAGVPYMYEINHVGPMYEFRRDKVWLDDDNAGFGASYTDDAGKIVPGNTFDYPYVHGKAIMAAGADAPGKPRNGCAGPNRSRLASSPACRK